MSPKIKQKIRTLLIAEDGPTTVEYAVLLALMVGMMISALIYVGDQAVGLSGDVVDGMDSALNK